MTSKTKFVVCLLVLGAFTTRAPVARACGGGGGMGGGGSMGGHSSCVEPDAIVGHERCRHFGDRWNERGMPTLFFEAAPFVTGVSLRSMPTVITAHHEGTTFHLDVGPNAIPSRTTLAGLTLRGGLALGRYAYVGAEVAFARLPYAGPTYTQDGLVERPSTFTHLHFGAFAGARMMFGPIGIRSELVVGERIDSADFASSYGTCNSWGEALMRSWMVMPRVGVEGRLNPMVTAGALVGTDLSSPSDWNAALFVRVSTRTYDGQFRRRGAPAS